MEFQDFDSFASSSSSVIGSSSSHGASPLNAKLIEDDQLLQREQMLSLTWTSLKSIHSRVGLGKVNPAVLCGDKKEALVDKLMEENKVRWCDLDSDEQKCLLSRNTGIMSRQNTVEDKSVLQNKLEKMAVPPLEDSLNLKKEDISKPLCAGDLIFLNLNQLKNLYKNLCTSGVCCNTEENQACSDDAFENKKLITEHLINTLNITENDLSDDLLNIIHREKLLVQKKWQERLECTSPEISELHLQLLAPGSIRNLYTSKQIGLIEIVKNGKSKCHQFLDLSSNLLQWDEVVKSLLKTVTWQDLDQSCLETFEEIYETLKYIKDLLTYDLSSTVLTTEELLLLPTRILKDLSILNGLGCYQHSDNRYVYTFEGSSIWHEKVVANSLLWTGLTKTELVLYIDNIMQRLSPIDFCKCVIINGEQIKPKQDDVDESVTSNNKSEVPGETSSEDILDIRRENVLLQEKWQERLKCTSPEFSELHLQLLSHGSIRNLYTSKQIGLIGKVKNGKWKKYRFLDLSSNLLQWDQVVKSLLQKVTWKDLDQSCLQTFKHIYDSVNYVKNLLPDPTKASSATPPWEELLSLPERVIKDLSILKGLGCYEHDNGYIYKTLEGSTPDDKNVIASHLLLAGLTKSELRLYIENILERLSPTKSITSDNISAGDLVFLKLKQLKALYLRKGLSEDYMYIWKDGKRIASKIKIINSILNKNGKTRKDLHPGKREESKLRYWINLHHLPHKPVMIINKNGITRKDLHLGLLDSIEKREEANLRYWIHLHQLPHNPDIIPKTCLLLLTSQLRNDLMVRKGQGTVVEELCEKSIWKMLEETRVTRADLDEKCLKRLRDVNQSLQEVLDNKKKSVKCSPNDIIVLPKIILMDLFVLKGLGGFYKDSLSMLCSSCENGIIITSKLDIVLHLLWIGLKMDELKVYAKEVIQRISYVQLDFFS